MLIGSSVSNNHKIKVQVESNFASVRFIGNVSSLNISPNEVVKLAMRTDRRMLIIDFSKCYSYFSDGLKWLEQVSAYADCVEVRVRIIAPKGMSMHRLLKLMRYDRFMMINENLEEALRSRKGPAYKDKALFPEKIKS